MTVTAVGWGERSQDFVGQAWQLAASCVPDSYQPVPRIALTPHGPPGTLLPTTRPITLAAPHLRRSTIKHAVVHEPVVLHLAAGEIALGPSLDGEFQGPQLGWLCARLGHRPDVTLLLGSRGPQPSVHPHLELHHGARASNLSAGANRSKRNWRAAH